MASGGLELALVSRGTAVLAEWSAVGGTCAQLPAARRRHGGATGACSVDSGYMLHFIFAHEFGPFGSLFVPCF